MYQTDASSLFDLFDIIWDICIQNQSDSKLYLAHIFVSYFQLEIDLQTFDLPEANSISKSDTLEFCSANVRGKNDTSVIKVLFPDPVFVAVDIISGNRDVYL